MKRYAVKTSFVFTGTFFITAGSKGEAKEFVESRCGLVLGGNIRSSLPYEVADWDFPVHPDKVIGRVSINKETGGRDEQTA
jgi:hypothetical protein